MHPYTKAGLEALVRTAKSDEERKSLLAQTGEQAIFQGYQRIVQEVSTPGNAHQKLDSIVNIVHATSEIIEFVNDTIIFYGYGQMYQPEQTEKEPK